MKSPVSNSILQSWRPASPPSGPFSASLITKKLAPTPLHRAATPSAHSSASSPAAKQAPPIPLAKALSSIAVTLKAALTVQIKMGEQGYNMVSQASNLRRVTAEAREARNCSETRLASEKPQRLTLWPRIVGDRRRMQRGKVGHEGF